MSFFADIAHELRTQDNCATADPIFVVQQKRRVYGLEEGYADGFSWHDPDNDWDEASEELAAELQAAHDDAGETGNWIRIGYRDDWQFVTACLTRKGAEAFIARKRHDLNSPRVYVESAYHNAEWKQLREAILEHAEAAQ